MEKTLNWWVPVLKGIVFFGLGIYIINQPDQSMEAFITSFGLILIILGIGLTAFAYYTRNNLTNFKSYLILGIALILVGFFMMFNEPLARKFLQLIMGGVIGFSGVMNLLAAFTIKKQKVPFWIWVLSVSILELIIAFIFIFYPTIVGLTLMTLLGVGMIVFGMSNVLIGINIKRSISFIKNLEE